MHRDSPAAAPSKLAVISDIHGNRMALEAVIEDIHRRQIEHIINLGDSLYGPLDPGGTADILVKHHIMSISGNEDRIILESSGSAKDSASLDFTRQCLSPVHLRWLGTLKMTAIAYDTFYMFHGTPSHNDIYFLQRVSSSGIVPRDSEELAAKLVAVSQPVILCGHDHMPCLLRPPGGRLIVNPGSVGLQAFVDDRPYPHFMQTGSPDARYAIIEKSKDDWRAEIITIGYDWEKAAVMAGMNGRPDWVPWLRTGRAR